MKNKNTWNIFRALLLITDAVLVFLSFMLAYKLRFYSQVVPVLKGIPSFTAYSNVIPLAVSIWILIYIHYGFYGKKHSVDAYVEFFQVIRANVFASLIIMGLSFMYRDFSYSRLVLIYTGIIATLLVYLFHEIIKCLEYFVNKWLGVKYKLLIIGSGESLKAIRSILEKKHNTELSVLKEPGEDIEAYLSGKGIDEIIVAKSPVNHKEVLGLVDACEALNVKINVLPDILELRLGSISMDDYYGTPVLQINPVSLSRGNFLLKRISDIIISILAISITIIPLLLIALLLKLDTKGPVFHKQLRMGHRGDKFSFLKFRSMVANADDMLKDLMHLSEREGPVFKIKDDPRITKIGKFIRRYSIDEIPQFYNVLKGDMSIVGPRPQVLWEASYYDDWAKKRLRVLPGITGYWQISGRSDLSYEDMIKLDIYYIENWSFKLDFIIMMKTFPAMFSKSGAY